MDISKIDISFIETFDLSYTIAKDVFGAEPICASANLQKKIRKWIEKTYIAGETYPKEVMQYIGKAVSNADFFQFLKACHDHIQLNGTRRKQLFDQASADLTEEVKDAICALLEHTYGSDIRKDGTDAQIDIDFGEGYNRTLTLVNASGIPQGDIVYLSFEEGALIKQGDEYQLIGEAETYEEDLPTPFTLRFTNAKVEISLFKANERLFSGTPWMLLQLIASDILDKSLLPGEYLNDREKELLPLIAEISKLSYWAYIPDEFRFSGFSQLQSYIAKFGYNELFPLIERLEKGFSNDKKKYRITKRLIYKLNHQKYEPLWRELYNLLVQSQNMYPSQAAVYCPTEFLNKTRSNIEKLMESHGYSGQYPDFVKTGSIRGVRLAKSYDRSYFIGAERNVIHSIHCTEVYSNEHLTVQFICGTQLLQKNQTPGDIYSCLFNAKGRRLFQTVSYKSDEVNRNAENEKDHLELCVQIAVKKAELLKLTKEERKALDDFDISYWKSFFYVFIVMGGLFGIFMTIGLMLIAAAACFIFAQPQTILSIFTGTPWWAFFLLSWVLFGGAMGIITVLAKRK